MLKETKGAHAHVEELGRKNLPNEQLLSFAKTVGGPMAMEDSTKGYLKQGTQICQESFDVFQSAYKSMAKQQMETEVMARKHISFLKDKSNQVAEAIARIDKMAGHDFEEKLKRLERFADAMEKLDRLNQAGKLDAIAKALRS